MGHPPLLQHVNDFLIGHPALYAKPGEHQLIQANGSAAGQNHLLKGTNTWVSQSITR